MNARFVALAPLIAGALLVSACSSDPSNRQAPSIDVKASDTACQVDTTTLVPGTRTFLVSNGGSQVTEVFVYAPGDQVVGEVDNIGPSTSKRLTVSLRAGSYDIACKPGMKGTGIRTPIVVKATSGAQPTTSPALDAAVARYRTYVVARAEELRQRVAPFAAAIRAGDVGKAKELYPAARAPYEAIEPVARLFGDLDSRIDARIDQVENGQEWIGFHRLEHDLWQTGDLTKDGAVVTALQSDVAKLATQVQRVELSAEQIANGAAQLLDEVSKSKVTGEEEHYSGLDLVDVEANVQGAEAAYRALRTILHTKDPELVVKLDLAFTVTKQNLAQYGSGSTFVSYDALSKAQVQALDSNIDALRRLFSQLATAVVED